MVRFYSHRPLPDGNAMCVSSDYVNLVRCFAQRNASAPMCQCRDVASPKKAEGHQLLAEGHRNWCAVKVANLGKIIFIMQNHTLWFILGS